MGDPINWDDGVDFIMHLPEMLAKRRETDKQMRGLLAGLSENSREATWVELSAVLDEMVREAVRDTLEAGHLVYGKWPPVETLQELLEMRHRHRRGEEED